MRINLSSVKASVLSGFADLTKALKQTKIVSCAITTGPVQWKNTGKKFLKGSEELGELETFLMSKVRNTDVL